MNAAEKLRRDHARHLLERLGVAAFHGLTLRQLERFPRSVAAEAGLLPDLEAAIAAASSPKTQEG